MSMILQHATTVTTNEGPDVFVAKDQEIRIEDDIIAAVGKEIPAPKDRAASRFDCSGKIVMPGLINCHSHLTEVLQRSFRDATRMESWKEQRAGTERLTELMSSEVQAAAELACAEMLKNGVTAVVDHFSTRPDLSVSKMTAILKAFGRTGIRGALAPSLRDQDYQQLLAGKLSETTAEKAADWQSRVTSVLTHVTERPSRWCLLLGPSSPLNCTEKLLREVTEVARRYGLGIHTHLMETRLQQWANKELHAGILFKKLRDLGFLSPQLSAAHGVWLDEADMDIFASSGASIVHNPASNLKLGSGIAPIAQLRQRGVNVALGTDGGDTSDTYSIFDQMRLAAFLSRVRDTSPERWLTAADAFRMGTVNGAQAIPAWRGKSGQIKPGSNADLVILQPTIRMYPLNNIVNQLIFCENGESVETVIVAGRVVVHKGQLTEIDEAKLISKVVPIGQRLYKTYKSSIATQQEGTLAGLLYRRLCDETEQ